MIVLRELPLADYAAATEANLRGLGCSDEYALAAAARIIDHREARNLPNGWTAHLRPDEELHPGVGRFGS